jgi:hypothetical protein
MTKPHKRPRDPAQLAKVMIDIASGEVEDREPTTPPSDVASPRKIPKSSRPQ